MAVTLIRTLEEGSESSLKEGFNDKLLPLLSKCLLDYKKYTKERKEILGYGRTDKRYVVSKAGRLDKKIKELEAEWQEMVDSMGPGYASVLKPDNQKRPSDIALMRIKELHKKSRNS